MNMPGQVFQWRNVAVLAVTFLFLFLLNMMMDHPTVRAIEKRMEKEAGVMDVAELKCPSTPSEKSQNYVEDVNDEDYVEPAKEKSENIEDFIKNYRDTEFDAWMHTYTEVLEGLRPWKSAHFPNNIKSGEKIYESACGIGLNLVITPEILKEHGITDVEVHGNDYLQSSVDLGQDVLDRLAPTFGGHKGAVCQGDSTNLGHVEQYL